MWTNEAAISACTHDQSFFSGSVSSLYPSCLTIRRRFNDGLTVQVWNAATGAVAYTYNGYNVDAARRGETMKGVLPDLVFAVAWSHNGKRIVAITAPSLSPGMRPPARTFRFTQIFLSPGRPMIRVLSVP
jgi:hypothetical protein